MEYRNQSHTPAYDAIAATYDKEFEETLITRELRSRIWQSLLNRFRPGSHILELNSGTGTDAIFLAENNIAVTASDISEKMLEQAQSKIDTKKLHHLITLRKLSFEELGTLVDETTQESFQYDGVFSNFGGLNCAANLGKALGEIAQLLKPGGFFVVCLLNKICLWEISSFFFRAKFRNAVRRLPKEGIDAVIGKEKVHAWYYSPHQFIEMAKSWFIIEKIYGLSIVSPLQNSKNFAAQYPKITQSLLKIDTVLGDIFPFYNFGDHFVAECKRKRM